MHSSPLPCRLCDTPLGTVQITANECGITSLRFVDAAGALPQTPGRYLDEAEAQLHAYFDGTRKAFDLPLAPSGSPFQLAVLRELTQIPYGERRSYGQIAAALGRPGAARAVGAACHRNPIQILIPCHRVVGQNGAPTGYAAGLWRKQSLLGLESGLPPHVR